MEGELLPPSVVAITTTFLTVVGGLIGIYIAGRLKNAKPKSPERIDVAFEALEKIVKIKDDELKAKDITIAEQVKEIEYLRSIINGRIIKKEHI